MDQIKTLIKNCGPISVANFINEAMFNSVYGYYRTKKPIGKNGDFITAPEISQIFGELIGAYLYNLILSAKKPVTLVEMGAGNGTLFFDVVDIIKKIATKLDLLDQINNRINFNIIEISETLTKIQQEKLKNCGVDIVWHRDFASFKAHNKNREIYFFANELFDCFAINQFTKTALGWQEIMVGSNNNQLNFVVENFNYAKDKMVQSLVNQMLEGDKKIEEIENSAIFEHSFAAINFMQELCEALKEQGGAALIIDYGYYNLPFKNTLQAIKNHQYFNILQEASNCDITSLVNFQALENCAKKCALNSSFVTQRQFLLELQIEERAKILYKNENGAKNPAILRLIDPREMGDLFKCLIIWQK